MPKPSRSHDVANDRRDIDIDSSPFFKLLLLVNLTAKPFSALYERKHKITLTEWRVMFTIAQRPGIPASELGELLGLDKMTISRAVRSLERRRRLERKLDKLDRRRQHLDLTKNGRELYEIISPTASVREELLLSGLDDHQRQTLIALLDRLLTIARRLPD